MSQTASTPKRPPTTFVAPAPTHGASTSTTSSTTTTTATQSIQDLLAHAFGRLTQQRQQIAVQDLHVDHPVQRGLNRRRAQYMLGEIGGFNPALSGDLDVSERLDGTYWVMDGQHRLAVAEMAGVSRVWCTVYRGLTRDEENLFFRLKNDTRLRVRSTALEMWWSAFEGHDKAVLEQSGIIAGYGFEVAHNGTRESTRTGTNVIMAISAVQEIYTKGGAEWLRRVLGFLRDAFPDDHDALRNEMLLGSFDFLREFGTRVQYTDLLYKIRHITATKLLAEAGTITEYSSRRVRVSEWLRRAYNKGRRGESGRMLIRRERYTSRRGVSADEAFPSEARGLGGDTSDLLTPTPTAAPPVAGPAAGSRRG